jgi:hypothetical protein
MFPVDNNKPDVDRFEPLPVLTASRRARKLIQRTRTINDALIFIDLPEALLHFSSALVKLF